MSIRMTSGLPSLLSDSGCRPRTLGEFLRDLFVFASSYPRLGTEKGVVSEAFPYGDVRRFGAVGDGMTDNATAFHNWAMSTDAFKKVVPPSGGDYIVSKPIYLSSNTEMEIQEGAVIQMGIRMDSMFVADTVSNVHILGGGKVKGTNGVATSGSLERLFYFTNSSDISISGIELSLGVYGCHFNNCTDFDFNCTVRDIGQKSGSSGLSGYGCIAGLNCARFRIGGKYYQIGRHAIYISAGSSAGLIDDALIDGTYHSAIILASFNNQNITRNIKIGSAVLHNVGIAGAGAINVAKGTQNIAISSHVTMDGVAGYGINIEGDSTYTPAQNPQTITIDSPVLSNIGSDGIRIINASHIAIANPRIRICGGAGIRCSTAGTGQGSFTDDVSIASYEIESPSTVGISVAGGPRTTNVELGRGTISKAGKGKFSVAADTRLKYIGPGTTFPFVKLALVAGQTNSPFSATGANVFWIAPERGFLTELAGTLTAPISNGTLTLIVTVNGLAGANPLRVDLTDGSAFFTSSMGLQSVVAGDKIGVLYTTTSSFLPNGIANCFAQIRFVPFT